MEIISCKLDGIKWAIVGGKVLVDPRYINEYVMSLKEEKVSCKTRACLLAKAAVCVYCIGVAIHIFVMSG